MTVFICENSLEGILTGVYDAWDSKLGHSNVMLSCDENISFQLFNEYITVKADNIKSEKVINTVIKKVSERAFESIFYASLCEDLEKADLIYRFIVIGLHMGEAVIDHHSNDSVRRMFELGRNLLNETHLLKGFVRFSELKNNILFAKICPKNDVLLFLSPHFEDRLPEENWIIYDEKRNKASIHPARTSFYIAHDTSQLLEYEKILSDNEESFRKMWITFFDSIAIKERTNKRLQDQFARMRFRSNMLEFESQ